MGHSIQEYCKKINRQLSFVDTGSLFLTLLFMVLLATVITAEKRSDSKEIEYREGDGNSITDTPRGDVEKDTSKPFASKNGKTYTFSWCQGSSRISVKNKIYFSSTAEAESSGRTLSKLCKK